MEEGASGRYSTAHAEAVIDFSADGDNSDLQDVEQVWGGGVTMKIRTLRERMERELSSSVGELINEGVSVVLTGPPNAGKSSLINKLLKRDFAIVSPEAGTTRDVMTANIDLDGVKCKVSDTAGIRDAEGAEGIGVERAKDMTEGADVVVEVRGYGEEEERRRRRRGREGGGRKGMLLGSGIKSTSVKRGKVGSRG
ncbi:hypothetical protein TrCOL_g5780 [Triparma columacea]|uniref:G domain-containing protein n=1 Tax=Triparma columacea TaxID=722753 RepID=A0A9W7L466_9STRA|nr:hypothetical protein TrCOL_g5780 [Triparma columacea]